MKMFTLPRYEQLPDLPLYANQTIEVVHQILKDLTGDDKLPTAAMLHNYVSMGLISPPDGKYYGREHIARLIVVYAFKDIFTLQEIKQLFVLQRNYCDTQKAYDIFCDEIEWCISFAMSDATQMIPLPGVGNFEAKLMRSMCMALAYRYTVEHMAL